MAAVTEDSRMTLMTMIITTEGEDVIPTIHIHGDKNVTNPSKLTLDFFCLPANIKTTRKTNGGYTFTTDSKY